MSFKHIFEYNNHEQQNYELFLECWNTSDVIFQTIVFSLSKGGNKSLCTNQKVITLLKRFRNRKRFRGLNHCLVLCIQLSSYRQYSVLALLENSSEENSQTELVMFDKISSFRLREDIDSITHSLFRYNYASTINIQYTVKTSSPNTHTNIVHIHACSRYVRKTKIHSMILDMGICIRA